MIVERSGGAGAIERRPPLGRDALLDNLILYEPPRGTASPARFYRESCPQPSMSELPIPIPAGASILPIEASFAPEPFPGAARSGFRRRP